MGKRGGKKLANTPSGSQNPISMKSMLRHEHLKNLALLFCGGDAHVPSLAVFFGRRLAADGEAAGIAPDPELFSCQRCETILQPGVNCTVRIEKTPAKKRVRSKKSNAILTQNNVMYNCHFCSHRNLKRGTAKGHMKEICPPKPKTPPPRRKTKKDIPYVNCVHKENDSGIPVNMPSSPQRTEKDHMENSDVNTPRPMLTLERSRRKRKSKSGKPADPETVSATAGPEKSVGGSTKRKRKTWTSLREIAKQDKSSSSISLHIPFFCDLH